MSEAKRALRAELRARRAVFARGRPPLPVPPEMTALLTSRNIVASYLPIGGEADPALIAAACAAHGATLCLPHIVSKTGALRFLAWSHDDALHDGPLGLRQPPDGARALAPDIVLTPLLGFDRYGNRLGQGAGHYDRAFADAPDALRLGIAWSVQEVDDLPVDAWDMPLHGIITENGWINPEIMR